MAITLTCVSLILFLCIIADKFSGKFGMPTLILFMGIGMIFGSDGIFKIAFSNYEFAEKICMLALCFIMFYGGFNTKWATAKTVALKAILLSTIGVIITATITGLFCYIILKFSFVESFLIGSVLSSTDAASTSCPPLQLVFCYFLNVALVAAEGVDRINNAVFLASFKCVLDYIQAGHNLKSFAFKRLPYLLVVP